MTSLMTSYIILQFTHNKILNAQLLDMAHLQQHKDEIKFLIEERRYTHNDVLGHLMQNYGFRSSKRSIQRFCSEEQIHKSHQCNNEDLEALVSQTAVEVSYPKFPL